MASLDDILTTQKNGVVAINNLNRTLANVGLLLPCICTNLSQLVLNSILALPNTTSQTYLASTTSLIVAGSGICHSVSITVHAGSAQIYIYDCATVGAISASNCIYTSLPSNASSFKPYETITLPYALGLVIKTDAGMNACVAYTPSPA
jgi:hypothetical protein